MTGARASSKRDGSEPCLLAVMLTRMKRRDAWRKILEAEVRRWSALSAEELLAQLRVIRVYEVEFDGKTHQVEVALLNDAPEQVQVMVAVDDGSLPASIRPESDVFIRAKGTT
jgi:hypothetical protein